MSKGWPFSLLNDEQMSNWLGGVEHQPAIDNSLAVNLFLSKLESPIKQKPASCHLKTWCTTLRFYQVSSVASCNSCWGHYILYITVLLQYILSLPKVLQVPCEDRCFLDPQTPAEFRFFRASENLQKLGIQGGHCRRVVALRNFNHQNFDPFQLDVPGS